MYRPFTQPWADAFCEAINADAHYAQTARGWHWPLAFVLEPAPEYGYPREVAVQLDLSGGHCRGARIIEPEQITAPFTIRARYGPWKRMVTGDLDPVAAVMQGKATLVGSMATMMLHMNSARALVRCARAVPIEFPDEARSA